MHGWDRGWFSVPCSITAWPPLRPVLIIIIEIQASIKSVIHQNTPRPFALGVPCYGVNCVGLGGTQYRPPSHRDSKLAPVPPITFSVSHFMPQEGFLTTEEALLNERERLILAEKNS